MASQLFDDQRFPAVYSFVKTHFDMQVNDIRAMMRLPQPGVGMDAGCNFACAAAICNLISGISRVLYSPSNPEAGCGKAFIELLTAYYPWEPADEKRDAMAETMYKIVRNPLVHSLAAQDVPLTIEKGPLCESQIREIEAANCRPRWLGPALRCDSQGFTLSVPSFYWGVFELIRRLAGNSTQMKLAEERILSGRIVQGRPAWQGTLASSASPYCERNDRKP